MHLTVVDATGNKTERVSVPETAAAGRIVGKLVERLQLPLVGPEGRLISYKFHHERSGRQIDDEETLVEAGVREHDVLRLIADTAAPSIATAPMTQATPAPATAARAAPSGALVSDSAVAASRLSPTHAYSDRDLAHAGRTSVPAYRPRGLNPTIVLAIAIIALLGAGAGVVLATSAKSGGAHTNTRTQPPASATTPTTSTPTQTTPTGPTPAEEQHDRTAIMALLGSYQSAYSAHNLAGLASIFSPGITRHGLAAGGCTVARGRDTVLDDYRSQFEEGSGSYRLVGLSGNEIRIDNSTRAQVNAHYEIDPGGSGYVNFRFARLGDDWKVSEVYATCE